MAPIPPPASAPLPPSSQPFHRRFMLRVAGLPMESVHRLRCPDSRRWADEVLQDTERLAKSGQRVGDMLHDVIGGSEDEELRRALLRLRRDVFNNRLPEAPGALLQLVGEADSATAAELTQWLADRRALAERQDQGAGTLAAEMTAARGQLRSLAGEERLRAGLLLATPSLDAQLDGFLRSPLGAPDKKQRKVERSLVSYISRTVGKASPFSTFTGVALGAFTDGGGGADGLTATVADEWQSHPRLNVTALDRLVEAVLADPGRRADLPVALAPGWGLDEDRVRYVRRLVTAGDDDTAVTFDSVKDRLFFLRRSGTLERLLGLFEDSPVIRYGELSRWLETDQGADADECERYLAALFDLGMLQVPGLRTSVHDTDPLHAFQRSLRTLDRGWATELAHRLDEPLECVREFASADHARRRVLLEQLKGSLRRVQEELGAKARVPRTVLYEDVAAGREVTLDAGTWGRLAEVPLRSIERVLPAFDLTLPQRITFKGFFLARHRQGGRCDDLLKLVHDFHEDFFDQYLSFTSRRTPVDEDGNYVPEENWLGLPQLKALDTARQVFIEQMRKAWRERPADDAEIVLDGQALDAVATELTTVTSDFTPMSHHLQLARNPDGGQLLVLNRSYGGLSFPFSRFTHCFEGGGGLEADGETVAGGAVDGPSGAASRGEVSSLEEELLRRASETQPPGAVFAEVTGGPVTSNLNLHGRLTDYEIVCPGETGTLPAEYRIDLDDLHLVHDEAEDRLVLRSTRLDREVIPVYLGYLVPLALPEVPRTLLLLSPTSMSPLNIWGGVPEGEAVRKVTRRPRVRHGRVVLSRASWSAPASVLPLRKQGESEAEWFLGWHRWRRTHALPDQVFVTVSDSGGRGATGAKPSLLDFDSPLSLAAFEALLKNPAARVVLREMLPGAEELHTRSQRGSHVAELAVETLFHTPTTQEK